ncbi:MAG: phosphatidate cytidylyltransferase [Treponema sp.]|nr:phosphatidate cytidylyltransferase [Treponema sp.]
MNKLIQRLFIFFIGLPILLALVFFLPAYNHLCLNLLVIIFAVLGALEFQNILKLKNLYISAAEAVVLGGIIPFLVTAYVSFNFYRPTIIAGVMAASCWLLMSRIFSSKEQHDLFIGRMASGFAVLIYPGAFVSWIIVMSLLPEPDLLIIIFLLMVFLNDSLAWAAGMLFGDGNRGIVTVSPNKSIAGFIGGLLASVLVGAGGIVLIPMIFIPRYIMLVPSGILLGLLTGIAATLGDLGESVLKRSAGIKDSGVIIPGRGGILDSIDSVAMAAPVFYFTYRLLFVS